MQQAGLVAKGHLGTKLSRVMAEPEKAPSEVNGPEISSRKVLRVTEKEDQESHEMHTACLTEAQSLYALRAGDAFIHSRSVAPTKLTLLTNPKLASGLIFFSALS